MRVLFYSLARTLSYMYRPIIMSKSLTLKCRAYRRRTGEYQTFQPLPQILGDSLRPFREEGDRWVLQGSIERRGLSKAVCCSMCSTIMNNKKIWNVKQLFHDIKKKDHVLYLVPIRDNAAYCWLLSAYEEFCDTKTGVTITAADDASQLRRGWAVI